jgi:hypothetical protein
LDAVTVAGTTGGGTTSGRAGGIGGAAGGVGGAAGGVGGAAGAAVCAAPPGGGDFDLRSFLGAFLPLSAMSNVVFVDF